MQNTKPHYRVLLVGEDSAQCEVHSDLLRDVANCTIDVVSRIEGAFDWIARSNYHLVVADLGISSTDEGLGLVEQIKRISPVTAIILMSDRGTIEEAVSAIRMGADDYLKKPFHVDAFKLAVKRGLDRKTVFGDNVGASDFIFLLNSCQMISAALDQRKIFGVLQSYLSRELATTHSAIYQLSESEITRLDDPVAEMGQDRAMQEVMDISLQAASPLDKMAQSGEFVRFIDRGQLTPGLFVMRFRCVGAKDYFYVCLSPQRPEPYEAFENRLRLLKTQVEVSGRNIEQYMGVQKLAYLDDATGLYNTRYLNYTLEREIAQSQKTKKPFAILFIDVDRFKLVNDQHGHLVGTKILHELGSLLKRFVRERDTVFRYGGDEFVAILSPCDLPTARQVAERFRAAVEGHLFNEQEGLNLRTTISIGVALYPDHASSKRAVIEAADHAMYGAKHSTRNSVHVAGEAGASPKTEGEGAPT